MSLKSNSVQIYFLIACLFALALIKFIGPSSFYVTLVNALRYPEILNNDIFLSNSIYLSSSIFYEFFAKTGIMIENDVIGISIYLALSTLVLLSSFFMFKNYFGLKGSVEALLSVFLCCFLYYEFIYGAWPSILPPSSNTPSAFAHIFAYISLYFLLSKRILIAALLATLCLSLAIRQNFILFPIMFLYVVLNQDIRNRDLLYLVIPISYVVYVMFGASLQEASGGLHQQLIEMSAAIIQREQGDGSFHYQPIVANLLFFSSFIVFPLIVTRFEDHSLRVLGWSMFFITGSASLFSTVYNYVGYKFIPFPSLILLGVPFATKFYTFIFCAMVIALVLRTSALHWYEKLSAGFAIVILKGILLHIGVASAVVLAGIGVPRLISRMSNTHVKDWPVVRHVGHIPLGILLPSIVMLNVVMGIPKSYSGPDKIDPVAFRHSGSWTAVVWAKDSAWIAWKKLRDVDQGKGLIAFFEVTKDRLGHGFKYLYHPYASIIARKPQFPSLPPLVYHNPPLWHEAHRREVVAERMRDLLNRNKVIDDTVVGTILNFKLGLPIEVNDSLPNFLAKRDILVMVPRELDALFPERITRLVVDDYVLLIFGVSPS